MTIVAWALALLACESGAGSGTKPEAGDGGSGAMSGGSSGVGGGSGTGMSSGGVAGIGAAGGGFAGGGFPIPGFGGAAGAAGMIGGGGGFFSTGGIGGSGGSGLPSMCQEPAGSEPLFGGCVAPDGDDAGTPAELEGEITGVVSESDDAACFELGSFGDGERTTYVRVGEGADAVRLGLSLPQDVVAEGETVTLKYALRWNQWTETDGSIELRDAEGTLLVWMSKSLAGFEALNAPSEIAIAESERGCDVDDPCGTTERRELIITAEDVESRVASGKLAEVGNYWVLIERNEHITPDTSCTDVTGGHWVSLAVVRH